MSESSNLVSQVLEFSDSLTAMEEYFSRGWTDGLPVAPPTPERVAEFLQAAARNADDTIAVVATRRRHD